MNAAIQKTSFLTTDRAVTGRAVIVLPAPAAPTTRDIAARAQAARAERAACIETLEWAMTAIVLSAVLLFGAGLLHYGVPAGAAKTWALVALYTLATFGGGAIVFATGKALVHLARGFSLSRG